MPRSLAMRSSQMSSQEPSERDVLTAASIFNRLVICGVDVTVDPEAVATIATALAQARREAAEACLEIIEIWAYEWTSTDDLLRQMVANIRARHVEEQV